MKMGGLLFGGLFWGILISLIGLSIVLRYAFNIQLPLLRIFLGVIIILFGLKLIFWNTCKSNIKSKIYANTQGFAKEYDIVFTNRTVDLTGHAATKKFPREISVVFGSANVIVPDSINLEVTSTTVLGNTILPGRSFTGFGVDRYLINNNPDAPVQKIQTTTVFGKLVFKVVHLKDNTEGDKVNTQDTENY